MDWKVENDQGAARLPANSRVMIKGA